MKKKNNSLVLFLKNPKKLLVCKRIITVVVFYILFIVLYIFVSSFNTLICFISIFLVYLYVVFLKYVINNLKVCICFKNTYIQIKPFLKWSNLCGVLSQKDNRKTLEKN